MNLIRCAKGHFYDEERYPNGCPHCGQTSVSTVGYNEEGESLYTKPMTEVGSSGLMDVVETAKKEEVEDIQITKGFFGNLEPVVGWLVAINGNHFGEDFKLTAGKNFIGRSSGMDVSLSGDSSVSRERHAILLYEPKSNVFLVQPGDSKELFYLNGEVVLIATKIKPYDVLTIGESELVFIPFCSENFSWDIKKKEEK